MVGKLSLLTKLDRLVEFRKSMYDNLSFSYNTAIYNKHSTYLNMGTHCSGDG